MARSFTYSGPQESITLRGVLFERGQPVAIHDEDLAGKLANLDVFREDGAAPRPVKAAPEAGDNRDGLIVKLRGKVDELKAVIADLSARCESLKAENDELWAQIEATPDEGGDWMPEDASEEDEGDQPADCIPEDVDDDPDLRIPHAGSGIVPENWRNMHHFSLIKLAKELTGNPEISTKDEAVQAIEEALEAR